MDLIAQTVVDANVCVQNSSYGRADLGPVLTHASARDVRGKRLDRTCDFFRRNVPLNNQNGFCEDGVGSTGQTCLVGSRSSPARSSVANQNGSLPSVWEEVAGLKSLQPRTPH